MYMHNTEFGVLGGGRGGWCDGLVVSFCCCGDFVLILVFQLVSSTAVVAEGGDDAANKVVDRKRRRSIEGAGGVDLVSVVPVFHSSPS